MKPAERDHGRADAATRGARIVGVRDRSDIEVRDPKALRALAHPVRWSLIEVLLAEHTATATRCAEVLGEAVNSCSFHLRTLEKYGYIELVAGADGRERPWRLIEQRLSWGGMAGDEADLADPDPGDVSAAATELDEMLIERERQRQRAFLHRRAELPAQWRRAASAHGAYRWMTAEELADIGLEIEALFERFRARHDPASRPDGARMVRLLGVALPMLPPAQVDAP